jgi:hypothetical protein
MEDLETRQTIIMKGVICPEMGSSSRQTQDPSVRKCLTFQIQMTLQGLLRKISKTTITKPNRGYDDYPQGRIL